MVISAPVAYGILFAVGLLALVGFVIMFIRLGQATDQPKGKRPPMPLGWPISAQEPGSAPSATDEPPAGTDVHRHLTSR